MGKWTQRAQTITPATEVGRRQPHEFENTTAERTTLRHMSPSGGVSQSGVGTPGNGTPNRQNDWTCPKCGRAARRLGRTLTRELGRYGCFSCGAVWWARPAADEPSYSAEQTTAGSDPSRERQCEISPDQKDRDAGNHQAANTPPCPHCGQPGQRLNELVIDGTATYTCSSCRVYAERLPFAWSAVPPAGEPAVTATDDLTDDTAATNRQGKEKPATVESQSPAKIAARGR